MSETSDSLASAFLKLQGALVFFVVSPIWTGYCVSVLWGWYIVPTTALPALSIAMAIGTVTTTRLITHVPNWTQAFKDSDESSKNVGARMAASLFWPGFCLLWGFAVKQFV